MNGDIFYIRRTRQYFIEMRPFNYRYLEGGMAEYLANHGEANIYVIESVNELPQDTRNHESEVIQRLSENYRELEG